MRTLAYPAWMRHRLFWTLPLALVVLLLGLELRAEGDEAAYLFLALAFVLPLVYLFSLRRKALEISLEPEGLRHEGRLFPREDLKEVRLEGGRLRLRFGQGDLLLPLDLPGWDQALAHLGLSWREVEGLEDYLLRLRGREWLVHSLAYPPQEAEDVFLWGLGVYRRHMGRLWKALGVGLLALGVSLVFPSLHSFAFWPLIAILVLPLIFLLFVPYDLVRFRGGPGSFNPLFSEWRLHMDRERRRA